MFDFLNFPAVYKKQNHVVVRLDDDVIMSDQHLIIADNGANRRAFGQFNRFYRATYYF